MVPASLALLSVLSVAQPSTVAWDLTVELETPTEATPDQVCLVTPLNPARFEGPWSSGMCIDELALRGVLSGDVNSGYRIGEPSPSSTGLIEVPWFREACLDGLDDDAAVLDAFTAMRHPDASDQRCRNREPTGCEATWEFVPPPLTPQWPWVVMCSPTTKSPAERSVAFITVRAVDLDRGFTPSLTHFDVFGRSVQIRFDSVRTRHQLDAAQFQASVGILGGDYHRTAASPSFGGRARVALQPRCRTQRFRLREDPDLEASLTRTIALYDGADAGNLACDHPPIALHGVSPQPQDSAPSGPPRGPTDPAHMCIVEPADLRRGVFEMRVPVSTTPRRHQLDVRLDPPQDSAGSTAPVCSSSAWSDGDEPDIIDLEPTRVLLRWRWPCFAKTSAQLRCPAAHVQGGRACALTEQLGSDRCTYRCDATRRDRQSVGWPLTVELHHRALDMHWEYTLETIEAEIAGSLAADQRRFLVTRGPRHLPPSSTSDGRSAEPWPAWWTARRGDEIASV
nr:hypothetical protein [Deltaproteobacteria bacterium]